MSVFLHTNDDNYTANDDTKAIAIPLVFSQNAHTKKCLIVTCPYCVGPFE